MAFPLPGRILPIAPGTFRALRHRDFRLLWLGQVVSLTGTWMQFVAQSWLVLRLTDSAFHLGLVGFVNYLPVLLFGLVAGVMADRVARREALLWTQGAAMVLALVLFALTWLERVEFWHVAVLAFLVGTVGSFDIPIRQSLLLDLVGRDDLPNAIALNSLAFNGARVVGPSVAGLVLAGFGEAPVFLINGLSFAAVLTGLALMRPSPAAAAVSRSSWIAEIREGLGYIWRTAEARSILTLVLIASLFGLPYSILLPVFARDLLQVGARGLGFMTGATGLGAVTGALYLAGRKSLGQTGRTAAVAMSVLGASLIVFSRSGFFPLSIVLLFVIGGAMLVQLATGNTMLQLMAPERLRGRIVSLFLLAFVGMTPLGSLAAGWIADRFGARAAVLIGGGVCLIAGLWFAGRIPDFRRRVEGNPD
jgi:MFS family permease